MSVTERVQIIVSSAGAVTVKKDMNQIGKAAREAADGVDLLKGAIAAWVTGSGISMLARYGDTFVNIQNKLRLVDDSTQAVTQATNDLYNVAQDTRTAFESVTSLYQRSSDTLERMGKSAQEGVRFTELLSKAAASSGTGAELAAAGIEQFSQALSNGRLNGDELTSVMTNIPAVARVLADGLGVPVGALKQLGEQGELTSDKLVNAIFNSSEAIEQLFATQVPTISQGLQVIDNAFTRLAGVLETNVGVFGLVAQGLVFVGNNMEIVLLAVSPLIVALGILATQALGGLLISALSSTVVALGATGKAMLSLSTFILSGLVTAITAASGALTAFFGLLLANPLTATIALVAAVGVAFLGWLGVFDELWAAFQEFVTNVLDALGGLGDKIREWFGAFTGGKFDIDVQAKQLQDAAKVMNDGIKSSLKEGGAAAGDTLKKSVQDGAAAGGASAASALDSSFDRGAQKQTNINDVFVAKFEGTGRNIYDLWNNWGDSFIDSFGTTIGDLLVDFQQAQTENLRAQSSLYRAQADQLALENQLAKRNGGFSRDYYGGSSGSNSSVGKSTIAGFATGGDFMVGGNGGTDSQLVQFMATPGEKVSVETPQQQRQRQPAAQAPTAPPVTIINNMDPSGSLDVMRTRAGGDVIYNQMQADTRRFRRLLGTT